MAGLLNGFDRLDPLGRVRGYWHKCVVSTSQYYNSFNMIMAEHFESYNGGSSRNCWDLHVNSVRYSISVGVMVSKRIIGSFMLKRIWQAMCTLK